MAGKPLANERVTHIELIAWPVRRSAAANCTLLPQGASDGPCSKVASVGRRWAALQRTLLRWPWALGPAILRRCLAQQSAFRAVLLPNLQETQSFLRSAGLDCFLCSLLGDTPCSLTSIEERMQKGLWGQACKTASYDISAQSQQKGAESVFVFVIHNLLS